jgi:hypothetical protein
MVAIKAITTTATTAAMRDARNPLAWMLKTPKSEIEICSSPLRMAGPRFKSPIESSAVGVMKKGNPNCCDDLQISYSHINSILV